MRLHSITPILKAGFAALAVTTAFSALCFAQGKKGAAETRLFGTTPNGQQVFEYTLKNPAGMTVKIITYGARIADISVPGKNHHFADVVLGFKNLKGYLGPNDPFFGATIGRYANRIAKGTFMLDGKTYHIPINDGPNALHGGPQGFDKRVWQGKATIDSHGPVAELHYLSRDGEMGFPGNLNVTVRYTLEKNNSLRIEYTATTDKDTVINMTNHSYFNLSGAGSPTILNEKVMIDADHYTPINSTLIPTGKIAPVAGTPVDFRTLTKVGKHIHDNFQQLKYAGGYDFNYVLNHPGDLSVVAAKAVDPSSGRVLEVFTTQPGIQFYSGNQIKKPIHGVGGVYRQFSAMTFETQHFPDSPNHPNFPSTELHAGQTFYATTIYKFSVQ